MADKSTIELNLESQELEIALDDAEDSFVEFGNGVNAQTEKIRSFWEDAMESITSVTESLFRSAVDAVGGYISQLFDELSARLSKGRDDFIRTQMEVVKLDQALRAMGNTTGFTTKQLQDLALFFSQLTVFGVDAFRNAELVLARFSNIRGDIFKDALMAAANLAAITGDLTGAAEKFGEALHDPIRGLEMLAESGYKLSKSQQALVEKLLATNNIIGLQNFLLDVAAELMGGDAKEQADTFGGQIQRLNNILDNLFERIGSMLVPSLTQYFIPAAEAAGKVVDWLVKKFEESGDAIAEFTQKGIEVAIDWFWKLVDVGTTAFTYVQSAIEEFGSFFEGTWHAIKSVSMTVLASVIETLVDWAGKAKEVMLAFWEYVKDVWSKVMESAGIAWEGVGEGFKALADYLKNVLANMFDNFMAFWDGVQQLLSGNTWEMAWKNMEHGFASSLDKMKDKLKELAPDAGSIDFSEFADELRKGAEEAAEDSDDAFRDFDDRFKDNLDRNKDRVQGFVDQLKAIIAGEDIEPSEVNKAFAPHRGKGGEGEDRERTTSGLEDLVALNKRIQSAALMSPEQKSIDRQTDLLRDWKAQEDRNAAMIVGTVDEVIDLLGKKLPQPAVFG